MLHCKCIWFRSRLDQPGRLAGDWLDVSLFRVENKPTSKLFNKVLDNAEHPNTLRVASSLGTTHKRLMHRCSRIGCLVCSPCRLGYVEKAVDGKCRT